MLQELYPIITEGNAGTVIMLHFKYIVSIISQNSFKIMILFNCLLRQGVPFRVNRNYGTFNDV